MNTSDWPRLGVWLYQRAAPETFQPIPIKTWDQWINGRAPLPPRVIAVRVRQLREARGWSQEQLASQTGLSKDGISRRLEKYVPRSPERPLATGPRGGE